MNAPLAIEPDTAGRPIRVLPYALRWQPGGHRPGAHPAMGRGGEGVFRALVPLQGGGDPRRIDVRASIRDPFEGVHVRTFAPRRAITVTVLLDLSASMAFGTLKAEVAQLAATLAAAAGAAGDSFCLMGADSAPRSDLHVPATRRRGLAEDIRARILAAPCTAGGAHGLAEAAQTLPPARNLVFLVSDFLMETACTEAILDGLVRHDVIPVVVSDSRADGRLPRFGLLDLIDAETGRRRLVLMRPALRARWLEETTRRRTALEDLFAARGLAPFTLTDQFDDDALLAHLAQR